MERRNSDIKDLKNKLQGVSGFENQIEEVRRFLFEHYLWNYVRDEARLESLLTGKGGNCEAQTKLVVDFFTELFPVWPEGCELGIQCFQDHIQPVLYFKYRHEVWELVSGIKRSEIVAPIYAPPYLAWVFLQSKSIKTDIQIHQLCLVNMDYSADDSPQRRYKSNSTLRFQGGRGRYNQEDVPEKNHQHYRSFDKRYNNMSSNLFGSLQAGSGLINVTAW